MNINNMLMFEVVVTVPGWLMDDGTLWILGCFGPGGAGASGPVPITIQSPMLLPRQGGLINGLFVKGVKHLQNF